MYKESLTLEPDKLLEHDLSNQQSKTAPTRKLQFREILCPLTSNPVEAENCEQCLHKETFNRKHPLGFTLKSFICTYNTDEKH